LLATSGLRLDAARQFAETDFMASEAGAFIPPFPPRPAERPPTLELIQRARRNFLEVWPERAFEFQFFSTRVLARRVFICNSPDTVQYAFNAHNASFERKSPQMRHALAPLLGDGLFISDGETWRTRRRIVAPIVQASRVAEFAPIMVETVLEARARWESLPAPANIDVLSEMAQLTAEIICRTIFGRQLGREYAREVVDGFSDYQRKIHQIDVLSLVGLPDWLPRWYGPSIRRSVARIHGVLDDVIGTMRARRDQEPSVISRLLDARDEETGAPLDMQAIRNEAAVLFMAGHETTANTLAWTWYLLSQAPDVAARLHREIDEVLGDRPPLFEDLRRLDYTRAVIEETLRLYPPVPLLTREALQDEVIRKRPIPRGSLVMVVPWLLHRHRKLWADPDHFRPQRFLEGSGEPVSKYAYVPFSTGPRICAGMSFGLSEAILCLAALAQRFRLELEPGWRVEPVCRLTLRPAGGLPMRVQPR
jgi:cytochrome P450